MVAAGELTDGFLQCEGSFLFVLQGKTWAAGALDEDRFVSRPIAEFFAAVGPGRTVEVAKTELALFLGIAVLFRKAPQVQISAQQLSPAVLLEALKQAQKDAVVAMRREDRWSFAFCREGVPVSLFPAPGIAFPPGESITQQITTWAARNPDAVIFVYEDIRLRPAADAGKPFADYVGAKRSEGPRPSLLVKLGDRVVFRFDALSDTGSIGRGGENDLPLDNLSVSRKHARFRVAGDRVEIEDLGSDNGITSKGARVPKVSLAPGDEAGIGKYTLAYVRRGSADESAAAAAPSKPAPSKDPQFLETIVVTSSTAPNATIEHAGKAPDAHIPIAGWFVAPVHARVMRETKNYTVAHVAGMRAVRVNGRKVKTAALADGDVITLAGQTFVFRTAPAAAEKPAAPVGATSLGPKP